MSKWVYNKEIKTPRFHVMPGEPLLERHSNPVGRKYVRAQYGEDAIALVDFRDPTSFLKVVGADTDEKIKESFGKLKELCDEQLKTIKQLQAEKKQLLRELRLAGAAPATSEVKQNAS